MKTLLLITDLEIGGTPSVVRELAIRLPADVASLAPDGPVTQQIHDAGRPVTSLNLQHTLQFPLAVSRLTRLIKHNDYETVLSFLIHANTVAAAASLFCRGTRFIQSIQTTQPTPRWHWRLQSIVHHAADRIIVPSPSVADAAAEWSHIPREKLIVIPNAVDISPSPGTPEEGGGERDFELRKSPVDRNHPHPNPLPEYREREPRVIGFIGRLDPIKRIGDLIKAMTHLPDHRLEIFGEGSERPKLNYEIAKLELSDRVTLRGAIDRPEIALQQIDILVLPSAAEGFGLVLIEAMAAGVPVIATDVPGIRDVVRQNRTGLLVPVADPFAIATAVKQLADSSLRQRLTAAAFDEVNRRFTWNNVLPQYHSLLTK